MSFWQKSKLNENRYRFFLNWKSSSLIRKSQDISKVSVKHMHNNTTFNQWNNLFLDKFGKSLKDLSMKKHYNYFIECKKQDKISTILQTHQKISTNIKHFVSSTKSIEGQHKKHWKVHKKEDLRFLTQMTKMHISKLLVLIYLHPSINHQKGLLFNNLRLDKGEEKIPPTKVQNNMHKMILLSVNFT